jgi:hypothetical protein
MKSIIKKHSVIKASHEIAEQAQKGIKSTRKVQFEDLMFVDDVDEYIRTEEKGYTKVSKLNMPKKRKNLSGEDLDLAKKDGLDAGSILTKRRRSERSPDEEGSHDS